MSNEKKSGSNRQNSMEKIIVLDCGSQYTHLITKKVRDLGVYSEILPPETRASSIFGKTKGIIISGGPSSVFADGSPKVDPNIFDLKIPVLGICYGHQLMAEMLGGTVERGKRGEYGKTELEISGNVNLFEGLDKKSTVWMSHFDEVVKLPKGFVTCGKTGSKIAAMANLLKHLYSIQFHPEVTHTEQGMKILENFLFKICQVKKTWSLEKYMDQVETEVREKVGTKNVFVLLSGGIDSLVAFTLLNNFLGPCKVLGLHIDTGFMRKNESSDIEKALKAIGYDNFKVIKAADDFYGELEGVFDPEEKRKIIGRKFVEVFNREVKKLYLDSHNWLLGQGTIYPDTIESGKTKHAEKIKTHHNRVAEIEKLMIEGRVIEPLEKLYKDDVRKIGEMLGLPKDLVYRKPFPGPGLAIMTLCSDKNYKKDDFKLTKEENETVGEILEGTDLDYFVLPLKSVGVQGDERTYAHPLVLQGNLKVVDVKDEEKAVYDLLEKIATEIPNSLKMINRVIFAVDPKHITDFKIKKSFLTKERTSLLREADSVVRKNLEEAEISARILEMPVVMLPLSLHGGESIVLRPLTTENFMTIRFARIPFKILWDISNSLLSIGGIDAVFYDITNKPPATVQWE